MFSEFILILDQWFYCDSKLQWVVISKNAVEKHWRKSSVKKKTGTREVPSDFGFMVCLINFFFFCRKVKRKKSITFYSYVVLLMRKKYFYLMWKITIYKYCHNNPGNIILKKEYFMFWKSCTENKICNNRNLSLKTIKGEKS